MYNVGVIPYDGTPREVTVTISIAVTIIYVILSVIGLVLALTCLVFNLLFRDSR